VKELLRACIHSIYKYSAGFRVEIIVVDNASTDNSRKEITAIFPDLVWIQNDTNAGFSEANNQGMRIAKAPFIFLLNPDTEVLEQSLSTLLMGMKKFPASIVVPQLLNTNGSLQISCWPFPRLINVIVEALFLDRLFKLNNYPIQNFDSSFQPDCASGAALLFDRKVLEATNGLDPNLFWSEDVDFCFRARQTGFVVHYLPDARIYHHSGKSSIHNLNIPISNQLLSKAKYFRKHEGILVWAISLVFILIQIILRSLVFSILSLTGSKLMRIKRNAYFFSFKRFLQYVFLNSKSIV
jgi:hypothetical protein